MAVKNKDRFIILMILGLSIPLTQAKTTTVILDAHQLSLSYEALQMERYLTKFPSINTRIDKVSFRVINDNYALDQERAYFQDEEIALANPESFQAYYTAAMTIPIYAKDDHYVYFKNKIIEEADPKTFEPIGSNDDGEHYAIDKNHVFWQGQMINKADPLSFQYFGQKDLNAGYAIDHKHLYFQHKMVKEIDGKSFKLLYVKAENGELQYDGYSKDQYRVYFHNVVIEKADPASFRLLKTNVAIDNNNLFIKNKIITGVDVHTLVLLNNNFLKDHNHVYFRDNERLKRIEEADPTTFKVSIGDEDTLLGYDKNFAFELDGKGDYLVIVF